SRLGTINPATGAISELMTPTYGSSPYGITAGSGGNVWFSESDSGAIGSVNLQIRPHLVVTAAPPAATSAGSGFGLVVTAEYDAGMVATDYTAPVTITLASGPGAVLGGTLTATPLHGVASFSGLTVSAPGSGFALVASGNGAASVTTGAFSIIGTTAP